MSLRSFARWLVLASVLCWVPSPAAEGAGWDRYAGGRLSTEGRNVLVYQRRIDSFRTVTLPVGTYVLNAGWDNVKLVINCLDPEGHPIRYVYLTPERFHMERR